MMSAPLKIVLSGASGLIGRSLVVSLRAAGNHVVRLVREAPQSGRPPEDRENTAILWDPYSARPLRDPSLLEGIDAAVHLSGDNLSSGRWTNEKKRLIVASRTTPTANLARVLSQLRRPPTLLISASAIGIYGERGNEILTEGSAPGEGFLPASVRAWEAATAAASTKGIRTIHLRLGVVLSPEGGALGKMLPAFRLGIAGRMGDGKQWMSWISLPDVIGIVHCLMGREDISGAVNAVAPQPVTNREFTETIGRVLHRPAIVPVPAAGLRLLFGEMAQATILASTRVVPERLLSSGYRFQHATLESALRFVLDRPDRV